MGRNKSLVSTIIKHPLCCWEWLIPGAGKASTKKNRLGALDTAKVLLMNQYYTWSPIDLGKTSDYSHIAYLHILPCHRASKKEYLEWLLFLHSSYDLW